jgi:hypothetical protein
LSRNNLPFELAIANWRRVHEDQSEPEARTCGSAERLYAAHPERRSRDDEVRVPRNALQAAEFDRLLARLTQDQRIAWLTRHHFRQPTEATPPEWIDKHYVAARVQLALWWGLLS